MRALILHNVTNYGDLAANGDTEAIEAIARDKRNAKGLAIFRRMPPDNEAPIEPGDRFQYVGALDFPAMDKADWSPRDVCDRAYAAGNSPYEGDTGVTEYRTWQVRSLSVGDVVLTEGRAFAVAGNGWQEITDRLGEFNFGRLAEYGRVT